MMQYTIVAILLNCKFRFYIKENPYFFFCVNKWSINLSYVYYTIYCVFFSQKQESEELTDNRGRRIPKTRNKPSMIHKLLLLLCVSDLCVIIGLQALWPSHWPWCSAGQKNCCRQDDETILRRRHSGYAPCAPAQPCVQS